MPKDFNTPAFTRSQIPELGLWLKSLAHVEDGGPSFSRSLSEQLLAMGLPIDRSSFTLTTMHPEVLWRTLLWEKGSEPKIIDRAHDLIAQQSFTTSPIPSLLAGGDPIHVPLNQDKLPYPICEDLKKLGYTDYYALGLPFSNGLRAYISLATRAVGGFQLEHREALKALVPDLAQRVELESNYHVTRVLLEIYLGKNASRRVLGGSFKRGQGEKIPAAIWFCDLRGFTELSDKNAPDAVIRILDSYFDIVTHAVDENGGEVLKFIGDAVLAIFPVSSSAKEACERSLKAASLALKKIEDAGPSLCQSLGKLEVGIGLHLGEVMYGNVGGKNRLDFTVISSAVNEASRIESLCKSLETPLLMSSVFAQETASMPLRSLGAHQLKGVGKPLEVFTLESYAKPI